VLPNQPVWREEETSHELLLLVAGRVKLTRATEAGRDIIVHACAPGEVLCAGLPCAGGRYCCTATVLHEPAEVLALPRRGLSEWLERSPTLARALLQEASRREKTLVQRIEELSAGHVERRVAALLTRLAEQVGVERPGEGLWLPIALSRQDLADMCGTTLETAIRTMTRLARAGLVRTAPSGFWITDGTRLAALARGR
jgi:CRP/FNR family transcriptional regulator